MKYFITEKTTETGKKFQLISEKADLIFEKSKELANEIGFEKWRSGYWDAYGGFSSLLFKEKPNEKVFKKVNGKNEWLPKKNIKEGREIQAKLDSIPTVSKDELNECIGFDGAPFKTIGFAPNNNEYFGFTVDVKWNLKIPNDCQEVTASKYMELFGSFG
jgi:hypothetical protein